MRSSVHRPQLHCHAATMRTVPTSTEELLWEQLRGSRLGVGFRRQVPLGGRYIGDFVAASAKLVVEVDGGYHDERTRADARRDRVLAQLGYRVVHLEAALVQHDLAAAVARIRVALAGG